ncbi:sugar phosphate isomerase [Streptomyces sp. TRM43335]|uniref:Sugar phosphate isomerase n=1 Tax=Streptomyces taklimakanensis TaxID=2569853 RepID=A0A6G2B6F4_9ACTN|nr:EboA domain-containing protein [Streptomyces taklimakanensis]MTE17841.1 sugar phosphate isomerase [Streptomyces taklimakanensis]
MTDGTVAGLRREIAARLDRAGREWLDRALAEAVRAAEDGAGEAPRTGPPAWELRFASAGRHCRPTAATAPVGAAATDTADAARVLLLRTARADAATLARLYGHGTAAERRAVLLALPHLDVGQGAVPIVEDALRTNDTTLVAAAVGPYAAEHIDAHAWRHAVLKCLFTGVPVSAVAGLEERARGDAELARMLRDHAAERAAAGRAVPDDLHRVLDLAATPHPEEG